MKFSPLKSSLFALALFAVPGTGFASQSAETGTMVVAQADQNDQTVDAIRKFLAGGKNLSQLDEDRLQKRLKRAKKFQQVEGLPEDLAIELQQEIAQLNNELANRQSAGGAAPAETTANAGTAEQSTAPAVEAQPEVQTKKNAAAESATGESTEAASFIQSVKPVADLNDKELRQQMRQAVQLSKDNGVNGEQRQQLRQIARDSRDEMQRRNGGAAETSTETPAAPATKKTQEQVQPETQTQAQADTGSVPTGAVSTFIQNVKPVATLNDTELRQQSRQAAELAKSQNLSAADRKQLRQIMREGRVEMARRNDGGNQSDTAAGNDSGSTAKQNNQQAETATQQTPVDNTKLDNTKVDAGSEQKARALLDANVDARKLNRADLRKRLSAMRDLLASNQLTPDTKNEMRQQLAEERVILRSQVDQTASAEQDNTTTANQGGNVSGSNNSQTNTNVTVNNNTTNVTNNETVQVVLRDRRPSKELKDPELRRRINVYRDVIVDNRYPEIERQELRVYLERDREILRERMIDERRRRQQQLTVGVQSGDIDIDLDLDFNDDRPPPPRSVFAAEADDQELEDILAAPPRRKIERRYTVDEVETNPNLRDAVARIEIDTVRFGFGEGFLREEEIDNLDRIAEIMEKIIAGNPNEVFMIEGHTDAVGSDGANLQLSRERAKAVKEALSTFYVIPPENLETVGFGERYLKIPTAEAEAENRRVSVARITPLVGARAD